MTNAGDAWRYLPEEYVGKALTQYLSDAIIAGNIDNGTFIFHGDPADFPLITTKGGSKFMPLLNRLRLNLIVNGPHYLISILI